MSSPPVLRVAECQACHHVSPLSENECPACLRNDQLQERFQCSRCERLLDEPKCPVCSVRKPPAPPPPTEPPERRVPAPRPRAASPGRPVPGEEPYPMGTDEWLPPFSRRVWPPARRRPPHPSPLPTRGYDLSMPVAFFGGLFSVVLSCISPIGPLVGLMAFLAALTAYGKVLTGRLPRTTLPLIHLGLICSLFALGLGVLLLFGSLLSSNVILQPQ